VRRSAPAPPFSPLHQLRIRSSAKSIAPCKLHSLKKLHGGLRGATWGWHLKPAPRPQLRIRSSAKSIAPSQLQPPKNPLKNLRGGLRGATLRGVLHAFQLRCFAIAPQHRKINCSSQLHSPKNLRGGLRCATRGLHLKVC